MTNSNEGGIYTLELPQIAGEAGKSISVKIATTDHDMDSARMLINKMYSWRGYGSHHNLSQQSTHMTFTASSEGEVMGTITLGVDSDAGMAADNIFCNEINTFRRVPGAKLCELTKLAFDVTTASKPMLAALFHLVFIFGKSQHDCTDLFIEVNPRHRRFYESMLGFKRVGDVKTNESVQAPAQLMWLKVSDIRAQIDELAGKTDSARSLYPFFFSSQEETRIVRQYGLPAHRISSLPVMNMAGKLIPRTSSLV